MSSVHQSATTTTETRTSTQIHLAEADLPAASAMARGSIVLWGCGAAGAAGIGRVAFPKQFQRFLEAQKLQGVGPTNGGAKLGLPSLLLGYPEDVSLADIQQIVNNPMTVTEMTTKFPEPEGGDYMAVKNGYLNIRAFREANANANPLAIQVVFESFSRSNDNVPPDIAQTALDKYSTISSDGGKLQSELTGRLLGAKAQVWASGATLLFLLGIADVFTFSDLYAGWFPDWPGGKNFPMSMWTLPHGSPFEIPNYWI